MTIIFFYVILQFPKFTISKISSSIVALFSPISHQPSSSRSTIVEVTSARQMVPREKCVWPNLEAAFFFLPPPLLAPVEHARERERNQDAIHGPMTVMQPSEMASTRQRFWQLHCAGFLHDPPGNPLRGGLPLGRRGRARLCVARAGIFETLASNNVENYL